MQSGHTAVTKIDSSFASQDQLLDVKSLLQGGPEEALSAPPLPRAFGVGGHHGKLEGLQCLQAPPRFLWNCGHVP